MANETTNDIRAADAKLHEALFGVTCEARYCAVNECGAWVEQESIYEERGLNHQLQRLVASNGRQECYQGPYGNWLTVPEYHADPIAIIAAEAVLPVALREDYASELIRVVGIDPSVIAFGEVQTRDLYALITATPQQRAEAMVRVLERAKAQEVAG